MPDKFRIGVTRDALSPSGEPICGREALKVLACMTASDAWSREYWAKGFRLFAMGVDAHLLQGAIRQGLTTLHALATPPQPKP